MRSGVMIRAAALVLLASGALAAVPPEDRQTEATIRANGFPCEKIDTWGPSKMTPDGEGTTVTCDRRYRYVLIHRRNAPVLVVADR